MGVRPTRRGPITRRAALAAALAAPAIMRVAKAQTRGGFDPKRFRGQSLEVMLVKNPRSDILQQHQKEFEAWTGITVGAEQIPEQQQRQKVVIEFNSGRTSFDVVMWPWHVLKRLGAKGRWLEDVRPYVADGALTAPDYDFGDFGEAGLAWARQGDGRIDTLPFFIDYWMLYWNKELFAAKSRGYPRNLAEMLDAAAALTDKAAGQFGWVSRGVKNANVPVWTSLMLGWGMDSVHPQTMALQTTTPEAIAAAELYQKLNRDFAPPGTIGFNWNESQTSFMQGRVAMWLDGIGFAPPLEDRTKSRVVGKVGYGVTPAGPTARHAATFGSGMGISSSSRKKEAAYLYCQWATNKLMQARLLQSGTGAPCRVSSYGDREVIANLKLPREWLDCMSESLKLGRPGLPEIIPVSEFRDIFGVALTNMISGGDAATELRKASEQFDPVLRKSEAG